MFDNSEEYDESGFVIKTREVLAPDKDTIQQQVMNTLSNEKESVVIRYVVKVITDKMGINITPSVPFIVEKVHQYIPPKINDTDRPILLLIYIFCMIIIIMQISIPQVKALNAVVGCNEQIMGYPITGNKSDISVIQYILCVANSFNTSKAPWTPLKVYSEDTIIAQMINAMETRLLSDVDISSKIEYKKRYLSYRQPDTLDTHSVSFWDTYEPFQNKLLLSSGISDMDKLPQYIANIQDYPKKYRINDIRTVFYQLSAQIQSAIYKIVYRNTQTMYHGKKNTPIKGTINSCCQTNADMSMFEYLVSENPQITSYATFASNLTTIFIKYLTLVRASTIHFLTNTNTPFRTIGYNNPTVYENTIDKMFAKYQKMISNVEVKKQSEHVKYTPTEFNNLLSTLYGNTLYKLKDISSILSANVFNPKDMVTYFTTTYAIIIPKILPIVLQSFIDNIVDIGNIIQTSPENIPSTLPRFRTYMQSRISHMYASIKSILTQGRARTKWLYTINPTHSDYMFSNFTTPSSMIRSFIQILKMVSCIIPNMIIHSKNYPNNVHMNLSDNHITDIYNMLNAKYVALKNAYNPLMVSVFSKLMPSLYTFMDILRITVTFSDQYLDMETTMLLIKFFTHSLIIGILEQSSVLLTTEYTIKQIQQAMIEYITTSFTICTTESQVINKKMGSLVDDNIQIKNNEKNNMLKELGNLSKDDQSSNRLMKQLKLGRWSAPSNLRVYTKKGYDKDNNNGIQDPNNMYNTLEDGAEITDLMDNDVGSYPVVPLYQDNTAMDDDDDMNEGDEDFRPEDFINDMGDADFDGDYYNVEYIEP